MLQTLARMRRKSRAWSVDADEQQMGASAAGENSNNNNNNNTNDGRKQDVSGGGITRAKRFSLASAPSPSLMTNAALKTPAVSDAGGTGMGEGGGGLLRLSSSTTTVDGSASELSTPPSSLLTTGINNNEISINKHQCSPSKRMASIHENGQKQHPLQKHYQRNSAGRVSRHPSSTLQSGAAAPPTRNGSSSLEASSAGASATGSAGASWAASSSYSSGWGGSRPLPPGSCEQLNTVGYGSPATSPGASSTQSQRSFHFSVANLRKSGVNLVKNIPSNIRRSSLAMFQMRAMGTVSSSVGGEEENSNSEQQRTASGKRRPPATAGAGGHRSSADSGASQSQSLAETLSLHRQRGFPALLEGQRQRCSNAGTAARRAMRKRISAAKQALRKISKISSNSTTTTTFPAASSSTASSPKTLHSPLCSLSISGTAAGTISNNGNNRSFSTATAGVSSSAIYGSHSNAGASEFLAHHRPKPKSKLRKCQSQSPAADVAQFGLQNNENLAVAVSSAGKRAEKQASEPKEPLPKKKRSWAFVMPSRKNKERRKEAAAEEAAEEDSGPVEADNNLLRDLGAATTKKKKQPLRPSLSWDPQRRQLDGQQRSRTSSAASQTSNNSRCRIHSDGSAAKQFISQWPLSLNSKFQSQPLTSGDAPIGEKTRQFEKRQQQQQKKVVSGGSKRRKKSTSALALCRGAVGVNRLDGSRSNSLSTIGPGTFEEEVEGLKKGALELTCLHCALQAEYRTSTLRAEIECAVKRLAARLSNSGSPARARRTLALGAEQRERRAREEAVAAAAVAEAVSSTAERRQMELLRRQMGTPDIVVSAAEVSSCNSEDTPDSADEGFWTNSSPSHANTSGANRSGCCPNEPSSTIVAASSCSLQHSTANGGQMNVVGGAAMPPAPSPATEDSSSLFNSIGQHQPQPLMDTLKPPGFPFGLPCCSSTTPSGSLGSSDLAGTNSPPRSNSVDLSQLRRDIELWSVNSLSSGDGYSMDGRPGTAGISTPGGDSIRTIRSRSYDPSSSPEHMLRRPSRIEHLSEIFKKALAKSPVVKRAALQQEQEQKRASMSKHRSSRYWLEEHLSPSEHIWLPSSSASATVDTECYLGEKDCEKAGDKRRCAACHIVAHTSCFPLLAKMNLTCKSTFRDCASSSSSTSNRRQHCKEALDGLLKHHWVHRWRLEGRCFHCAKSFQQKMFREKEVIAITCSWCKRSYHNKRCCFSLARFDDHCDRGALRELILPPGWLLRLGTQQRRHHHHRHQPQSSALQQQRSGSFSVKETPSLVKKSKRKYRQFIVKQQLDQPQPQPQQQLMMANGNGNEGTMTVQNGLSTPTFAPIQPLLVFVNPKSGGNKGAKTLNSLCWLLNPRQVFDITAMRGPRYGLEMFRKVLGQMRILVCGGDGTVGWVLSTLDSLGWPQFPPIALLPSGTGNDLSRSMGWGGTFSDEPFAEQLAAIQTETSITHLDRWRLEVWPLPAQPSASAPFDSQQQSPVHSPGLPAEAMTATTGNANSGGTQEEQQQQQQQHDDPQHQQQSATTTSTLPGATAEVTAPSPTNCQTTLPLSVMNNYFSIGADAHVALQFHHSRSANPQMLNSRLKNRLAYGGLGTIDLFKRTWKDLSEYIRVECDGVDITPKIREEKFHCILFHNIAFYAGGTVPWGAGGDGVQESCGEVFSRPSPCDGKLEVLGFTTATLAALQMGGKGERIAQCSKVRIETAKPIPMQVDGEPCLLGPSLIHLHFHNKVPMLRREKFARLSGSAPANNITSMNANRRKSSNNSSGGGGGGTTMPMLPTMQKAEMFGTGTGVERTMTTTTIPGQIQQQQLYLHKMSKASLGTAESLMMRPAASSPPNNVFLCVPVVVVGRDDYDTYRDSVERLKDTGFELGTLNVEAEMELGQTRQLVQQMLSHHQILPYEPGREWRFLDYVSNAEEGTFRVSRQQEHSRTVADVCSLNEGACILILDDAFPSMTVRSAAIGHELVFSPAAGAKPISAAEQSLLMRRRISETLRIVLSSESQETHL